MKQHLLLLAIALTTSISFGQDKPAPENIRATIRELRTKAGQLKAAGKLEEAQRVWNEAETLMRQAAALEGGTDKKPVRKPEAVAEQTDKNADARKKHLMEAIAHLRKAGMGELADKLQHHLAAHTKTEEVHRKPQGDHPKVKEGRAPDAVSKPQKPHGDAQAKPSGNEEIRSLRADLDELRRAMRELQQQLNRERGPRKD